MCQGISTQWNTTWQRKKNKPSLGTCNMEKPQNHDVDTKKILLQDFTGKVQTQAMLIYGIRIRMVIPWGEGMEGGVQERA